MKSSSQPHALANSSLKKEPLIINGQQMGASQSWYGLLEVRSIYAPAGN